MTDQEKAQVDSLLSQIEIAVGEFPDRSGPQRALITEIVEAVNGLRSLLSVVRAH
jgi:hypothetical protein